MSSEDNQSSVNENQAQDVEDKQDEAHQREEEEVNPEELMLTLQDAQAKADEYWNQLLRTKAELDNTQRRAKRDVESAHKFALEKFVTELLPVKDSLELGLSAASEENAGLEKLREGVELTLKMFTAALEKFGVSEVNPDGERFDPELHQAMTMQDAPDIEPNTVLSVFQKGYLLNGRLIRPAMVVVSGSQAKQS